MNRLLIAALTGTAVAAALAAPVSASTYNITIQGTDAIFLAGRTDLTIPDPSAPWGDNNPATDDGMLRHGNSTPEEAKETLPPSLGVAGGDIVRVLDPVSGGINFFNGNLNGFFGPEGNSSLTSSTIAGFGGISGYKGTQGALVGVFLDGSIPSGGPMPTTLDFAVVGTDFASLSPGLGQVFFIGDGQTSGGVFHEFVAPTGATRVFFGVPDAFAFNGVPGAYDDNDGSYKIRVGINAIPTIPLPAGALLLISALGAFGLIGRRRA
ncbi:VPLPA-CTERM sorting domain-containing protein [Roseovarius spongiae]|uniref:VPLPA-CTERM sorting domain-containing protein n=1 Tax=Roseovarius spongiae TaxID=2320272 RepID=A0A3A8BB91_9RHOB|nr:VPLPA-CTERM sorting domain-containing protein [Roseovarius spongiae]RKF16602.1 VPLPA-CTERM sorting domain-containing protein [Roseovarius spongiae]